MQEKYYNLNLTVFKIELNGYFNYTSGIKANKQKYK